MIAEQNRGACIAQVGKDSITRFNLFGIDGAIDAAIGVGGAKRKAQIQRDTPFRLLL